MTHPLRIKICGITSEVDAELAAALGADAVGLNFWPHSSRHIDAPIAQKILRRLPPFVEPVAVFTSVTPAEMMGTAETVGGIRTLQRHCVEHEPADFYGFRLIDAFQVPGRHSLDYVQNYLERCRRLGTVPAGIVVDGSSPGQFGGTGRVAPWQLLAGFHPGLPLILAGGLNPDNVAEAIRTVRPYAVDVASGVEKAPGQKDPEKIKRFIANAREAAAKLKD
jgi:phosphoribosylanthranilate isomerase